MGDFFLVLSIAFAAFGTGYITRFEEDRKRKEKQERKYERIRSKLANLSNETLADIDADDKRYRAMKARVK